MSAAMNRADMSIQSIGSQPDLSLGSFASGFSTPARNIRQPSGSTAASSAALATPSPPNAAQFNRRRLEEPTPLGKRRGLDEFDDNEGGDVLDTPGREKKWGEGLDVSAPGRPARTRSAGTKAGVNLTLRDQEKVRVFHVRGHVRMYVSMLSCVMRMAIAMTSSVTMTCLACYGSNPFLQ